MQGLFESITAATSSMIWGNANANDENDDSNSHSTTDGAGGALNPSIPYVLRPRIFTTGVGGGGADQHNTSSGSTQARRLKVVIRGARATGKTTLFRKLQGLPAVDPSAAASFRSSRPPSPAPSTPTYPYTPSSAIDVMRFSWHRNNIGADFDVWDVVDDGKPMPLAASGYSFTSAAGPGGGGSSSSGLTVRQIVKGAPKNLPMLPIDSTTIDVYKGGGACDLAIFLYDRSRRETFDFVCREVKKVPRNVPIIIGSNFSDRPRDGQSTSSGGGKGSGDASYNGVSFDEEEALLRSISPAVTDMIAAAMGPSLAKALQLAVDSSSPSCSESDCSDGERRRGRTSPSPAAQSTRRLLKVAPEVQFIPKGLCVPPLLISFSLVCGYGMRPLHAALEAVVAFHRAKELEAHTRICYNLVDKAQSDAIKEDEEQTYKSYVALLRQLDKQNGTREAALIPPPPSSSSSPAHHSHNHKTHRHSAHQASTRKPDGNRRRKSSSSSSSSALSTSSSSSASERRNRHGHAAGTSRGKMHSAQQPSASTSVAAMAKVSSQSAEKAPQQHASLKSDPRRGDVSILDTRFAADIAAGGGGGGGPPRNAMHPTSTERQGGSGVAAGGRGFFANIVGSKKSAPSTPATATEGQEGLPKKPAATNIHDFLADVTDSSEDDDDDAPDKASSAEARNIHGENGTAEDKKSDHHHHHHHHHSTNAQHSFLASKVTTRSVDAAKDSNDRRARLEQRRAEAEAAALEAEEANKDPLLRVNQKVVGDSSNDSVDVNAVATPSSDPFSRALSSKSQAIAAAHTSMDALAMVEHFKKQLEEAVIDEDDDSDESEEEGERVGGKKKVATVSKDESRKDKKSEKKSKKEKKEKKPKKEKEEKKSKKQKKKSRRSSSNSSSSASEGFEKPAYIQSAYHTAGGIGKRNKPKHSALPSRRSASSCSSNSLDEGGRGGGGTPTRPNYNSSDVAAIDSFYADDDHKKKVPKDTATSPSVVPAMPSSRFTGIGPTGMVAPSGDSHDPNSHRSGTDGGGGIVNALLGGLITGAGIVGGGGGGGGGGSYQDISSTPSNRVGERNQSRRHEEGGRGGAAPPPINPNHRGPTSISSADAQRRPQQQQAGVGGEEAFRSGYIPNHSYYDAVPTEGRGLLQ